MNNIVFVVPLLLHRKKVSHIFILFFNNGNIYSQYFKPFHLIIARYLYHKTTTLFLLDSMLIKVFDILHYFPTKFRSEICDGALHLTLSWWRSLSYRNQSIDLLYKSADWFLHDRDLRHESVNPAHINRVQNQQ